MFIPTSFQVLTKSLSTSKIPSSPTSLSVGPLPICPALKRKSALRPQPKLLPASTAAPAARSRSATEPWPLAAAQCSGVRPQGGQGNGSGRSPGPWRKFASEVFQGKTCSMTICRTCASEIIETILKEMKLATDTKFNLELT